MDFPSVLLHRQLTGQRLATRPFDGPQDARIVSANAATGTCMFVIPSFSTEVSFGPAPYPQANVAPTSLTTTDGISPDPHGHPPVPPPVGARCLAVFAGPDPQGDYTPWVVAIDWGGNLP